jgi:hypothetical protein
MLWEHRHRTIVNETQASGTDGSEFEDEVRLMIRCEPQDAFVSVPRFTLDQRDQRR